MRSAWLLTGQRDGVMNDPRELRKLAAWYRTFADRAGDPVIWEARLKTAEELEREADQLAKIGRRPGA
jgi:hypothetical protein